MKIDSSIVKEIHGIEIRGDMTLQEIYNKFYELMNKHGIKQWHKSEESNGHTGNSPEYVMCNTIFKQHIDMMLVFFGLGVNDCGFEIPDYMWEGGKGE